jgi:AbrB family looped-hinge helix DNA binding protein
MMVGMTYAQELAARGDVSVAADGRVTIPAQLRAAVGIEPGSTLVAYLERGRIVLEDREHLLRRVQDEAIAAAEAAEHTESAVGSLLADRRAEATHEDASPNAAVGRPA